MQMEDCCVLVLDAAGEVRSMNTCRPFYEKEQGMVNGCLSKRQTGSAIKPFLYLFAMNALQYTGGTKIVDEPVSYYLDEEHIYSPKNFSLSYHGGLKDPIHGSHRSPIHGVPRRPMHGALGRPMMGRLSSLCFPLQSLHRRLLVLSHDDPQVHASARNSLTLRT